MLWFLILFSYCKFEMPRSFSFMTQYKKVVQLDKADKYLNNNDIFPAFINKFHKNNEAKNLQKEWYYVHFLTQNISEIFNLLKVERKKEIIKNTFTLFLSTKQIEQISNIALVKKINP